MNSLLSKYKIVAGEEFLFKSVVDLLKQIDNAIKIHINMSHKNDYINDGYHKLYEAIKYCLVCTECDKLKKLTCVENMGQFLNVISNIHNVNFVGLLSKYYQLQNIVICDKTFEDGIITEIDYYCMSHDQIKNKYIIDLLIHKKFKTLSYILDNKLGKITIDMLIEVIDSMVSLHKKQQNIFLIFCFLNRRFDSITFYKNKCIIIKWDEFCQETGCEKMIHNKVNHQLCHLFPGGFYHKGNVGKIYPESDEIILMGKIIDDDNISIIDEEYNKFKNVKKITFTIFL